MRYRSIAVRIWGDEKFCSLTPLQPSGQALFIYLLTNPNTNSIPGLYRIGEAAMAEELKWSIEAFRKVFQEVICAGLAEGDFCARVIYIPNAIKYNKPQSPNVIKSWKMHWDEIPECALKNIAYQSLKAFIEGMGEAFLKAFLKACGKPSVKTMANQEQEQEQDIYIAPLSPTPVDNSKIKTQGFADFYKIYPRKKDLKRAEYAWKKNKLDSIANLIIDDVKKRIEQDSSWQDQKFIPYPATYLNNKRWEDEMTSNAKSEMKSTVPFFNPEEALPERTKEQTENGRCQLDEIKKQLKGGVLPH